MSKPLNSHRLKEAGDVISRNTFAKSLNIYDNLAAYVRRSRCLPPSA